MESRIIDFCNAADLSDRQCDALLQTLGELCSCLAEEGKEKSKGKTPYRQFIGKCIKGRPAGETVAEAMKRCAGEWKKERAEKD